MTAHALRPSIGQVLEVPLPFNQNDAVDEVEEGVFHALFWIARLSSVVIRSQMPRSRLSRLTRSLAAHRLPGSMGDCRRARSPKRWKSGLRRCYCVLRWIINFPVSLPASSADLHRSKTLDGVLCQERYSRYPSENTLPETPRNRLGNDCRSLNAECGLYRSSALFSTKRESPERDRCLNLNASDGE